jgi:uncharacterized protein DUF4388
MSDDLVRINGKGEAHPIGRVAGRRMRDREGTFRMLPAPKHVVFMRYTGDDGRRDDVDGAIVKMAGEITEPAALCDVLAMMLHTRWRGELVVLAADGATRTLFLENGNVVGAETSVHEERLGRVMFRFGALDDAALEAILAEVAGGGRFGESAVVLGFATHEQIYHWVGKQIEEILYGAMSVDDGTFFFLEGFDADRLASHHVLSTTSLLMDMVTRLDEEKYFRHKIPSSEWVPVLSEMHGTVPDEYRDVYAAIDGRRSIIDLGRVTGAGEFAATKAVYALAQSHHLTLQPPRLSGGPAALVETMNAALAPLYRRIDGAGKGHPFREAMSAFAAGAGVYEMLFRGAGPSDKGTFEPQRVCDNLARIAGAGEEEYLKSALHEYVSFAVFSAGSVLGAAAEHELLRQVTELLALLQPPGS